MTVSVDTAALGEVVRNLTTWEDASATGFVFAVGNAAFAAFFIGRRVIFLLWLAFVAAFVLPLRERADALDTLPFADALHAASEALHAATTAAKGLITVVRERFLPLP